MSDAVVNKPRTEHPQPGIGDNGGPKLSKFTAKGKVERIKEVLDMDISSAQKCIGIRIIADADTDGVTPELSTEDLKRSASVKDRETVYRATRKLDEVRVAKAVKAHGRPNRYIVLSDGEIDAAIDEIDETAPVKPDITLRSNPTGHTTQTSPVQPDHPVRLDPTGGVQQDGSNQQDAPARTPAPAGDNTTRATKESPSEILTSEDLASKLASWEREHQTQPQTVEPVGLLAGQDNLTEQMVADVHRWLGPPSTVANARQWLQTTLRAYGDRVVEDSYQKLKSDIAEGKRIASPIATWSKIAQRIRDERDLQAPASDVCWVDGNGLHVVNGFRAEWLQKFDNNEERLDMAIKAIAPDVKLKSQTPIKVQVDGMLAKLIGEKIDKDARYARAATQSKPEKGISRLKEKFLRAGE